MKKEKKRFRRSVILKITCLSLLLLVCFSSISYAQSSDTTHTQAASILEKIEKDMNALTSELVASKKASEQMETKHENLLKTIEDKNETIDSMREKIQALAKNLEEKEKSLAKKKSDITSLRQKQEHTLSTLELKITSLKKELELETEAVKTQIKKIDELNQLEVQFVS